MIGPSFADRSRDVAMATNSEGMKSAKLAYSPRFIRRLGIPKMISLEEGNIDGRVNSGDNPATSCIHLVS